MQYSGFHSAINNLIIVRRIWQIMFISISIYICFVDSKKKHETSNYLIKSDIHWWSTKIISIDDFKRKGNGTLFI
jgi:hypothetical protein